MYFLEKKFWETIYGTKEQFKVFKRRGKIVEASVSASAIVHTNPVNTSSMESAATQESQCDASK